MKAIGDWYFNSLAWLCIPMLEGFILALLGFELRARIAVALLTGIVMLIFTQL